MDQTRPTATPTMADVARLAGVSKMTVSRALSGRAVSAETQARVRAAADAVHYVPDAAAGALSSGRSRFVAALVPTLANANFADTIRGLSDGLADAGLQVLLGYTDYHLDREEALVRAMLQHRPEAVVLTGGDHRPGTRAVLGRARTLVLETWDLPAQPLGLVAGFSNAAAAAQMVRHLAARGFRRIAFIGGDRTGDGVVEGLGEGVGDGRRDWRGEDRRRGYIEALTALGLGPPRIVDHGAPPIGSGQGAAAMALLMQRWPDTDAVFCVSDLSAYGAVVACHRNGWAIPGRVAVAGFGDFDGAAGCFPALTTVQVDPHAIGQAAARLLLDAMAGNHPEPAALPVRIVQREST